MSDTYVIEFNNVNKTYTGEGTGGGRPVAAVADINLALHRGQFVAVQGPSGCGKSTLLLIAGTLLHPDDGTVSIDGQNPYDLSPEARATFRAKQIGFVFQQFHLIPYLTVRENILAAGHTLSPDHANNKADALIESLGLTDRVAHVPGTLSTGERQRTALARAMLNEPKLILADEPTGNLDEQNTAIVIEQLRTFANEGGTVMMVTHDPQAAAASDEIIQMNNGEIVPSVLTP